MSLPPVTLILGGARSGKSAYGEALAARHPGARIYIATAEAGDAEMAARIRHHQARRGGDWETHEVPLDLAGALARHGGPERCLLVDCLTLWLSNLMMAEADLPAESARLLALLAAPPGPLVLIANEVGLGIVPENALARAFRDHAGRLNQEVAALAQSVVLLTAGLPLVLKGAAP